MRNFYLMGILLCMLMIGGSATAGPPLPNEKRTVATAPALNAPEFTPDSWQYYVIQTDISFRVSKMNSRGILEVWRSKTNEENYVLAGTATDPFFYDYNLPPRTEFKYKMRVVDGSEVSPWSGIKYVKTESKYYEPTVVTLRPGYDEPLMEMTDNTYYDDSYTVYRIDENGSTELYTFSLPDSGQVYTLWDDPLPRPGIVTYRIQMNLPYYVETDPNSYYYDYQFEGRLPTPELENGEQWDYVCGSQNKLEFWSAGDASIHNTEIYRSLNEDGPWTLLATVPSTAYQYLDDVAPRTNFYYKVRQVYNGMYSDYSTILYIEGDSDWYTPGFELTLNGSAVQVKITDNSYQDAAYRLYRDDIPTYLETIVLPDSGSVYIYNDTTVLPGHTYTYNLEATTMNYCDGWPYEDGVAQAEITTPAVTPTLPTPAVGDGSYADPTCGSVNRLSFSYVGNSYETTVEVYRALSSDGPYFKIATAYEYEYLDDVSPRVNYYYKIRILRDEEVSDFSEPVYIIGKSDWYVPELAVSMDGSAIQVKITGKSDAGVAYRLMRGDLPIYYELNIPTDSGSVFIYNDTNVVPGRTYEYFLEATVFQSCDDYPYEDIVATAAITTPVPQDYTINSFTLVDPVTDTDVEELVPNMQISVVAPYFLNIRANTDAKTKSVMFFLNNKRRSDNGAPTFTYFPEKNGDYQAGLTEPGHYILEATPYSEKNGKGIKGETIIIEFDVLRPDIEPEPEYVIKSFSLIDPETDQEIGPLVDGAVVDVSLSANIRANTDSKTKAVMFFLNNKRRADNGAPIFSYFPEKDGDYAPGLVTTGHYVLKATPSSEKNAQGIVGETVTIQFDVVCSSCDASEAQLARIGEVSFFPNPVVSTSQLKIRTLPGSDVRIQVVDQLGQPRTSLISLTADESGALLHPVSALNLGKGTYLLSVEVNGQQVMKRFVVE